MNLQVGGLERGQAANEQIICFSNDVNRKR